MAVLVKGVEDDEKRGGQDGQEVGKVTGESFVKVGGRNGR